jgi:MFS superfamily sulfate permease-like transporter
MPLRSSSRTSVAEAAGARTQLTGVVGALAVALLLLMAPNLPTTAVAAVVIASAIGLFETTDLSRIYRIQRWNSSCQSSASSAWQFSARFLE